MEPKPKVALVHEWLTTLGGSEKVLWQLHLLYPEAPIYTLVYDPACGNGLFKECDVRTTWLQKIPFATKLYKKMLSLMPRAWESLDLTEYDLVISSSSSCCKGVITRPGAVHICYCHTPTRYLWDFYHTYLKSAGLLKRWLMPRMVHKLRMWDRLAADRVDYFVANSRYIAQRIQKYYRREADVIYPSVRLSDYTPQENPEDYYLMVGRFVYYKRVDLAIEACNRLGRRLIIVGDGDEAKRLRALAGPTITFLGAVSDEEIRTLYLKAKAFLFPGEEDFGITPVEAQSAGCPVLAYGKGGALETVADGETGLFFEEQTPESLAQCIQRFEREGVRRSRADIRKHSLRFSEERFRKEIQAYCLQKVEEAKERREHGSGDSLAPAAMPGPEA